jgi:protein SCO1
MKHLVASGWLLALGIACAPALAETDAQLVQSVGIEQKLGAALPLSAQFADTDGRRRPLADYLGQRPAVLMFGYYHCRNLCSTDLDALARAVLTAPLQAGSDAEILFVGIDPQETAATAAAKQQLYARAFPQAQLPRWHFLTGDAAAISGLAQAAGFHFTRDAVRDEYIHPAGVVLVTSAGKVSSYLPGAAIDPAALRAGVSIAAHGRIGALAERVLVLCSQFDSHAGSFGPVVLRLVQGLAFATLLGLALLIVRMRQRPPGPERP